MIVINNLNKYYNKGKNNEIHVINNTSIVLPDKGLVCFLGPSGCGKTTLLNVIGGMDNANSGTISYNGKIFSQKEKDEFRAKEMGFIFQNYVLFNDKTVYDNLKLVLNIFDMTDEEANERINKALSAVNMQKFQRRLCKQLSGGQMQRVAIARALVKSPNVIIADEPTGNLDEKNTTQIMNIIKKLSLECLVILVTHEVRLASFYGDKIINILDGKIVNSYENLNKGKFVEKDDVNIYLGDMDNDNFQKDDVNIKYFYNKIKPPLKLDIVYRNDTIYLKCSSSNPRVKFKLLDKSSENVLIDSKKPELNIEDIELNGFEIPNIKKDKIRRSIISFKESFKHAWEYLKGIRLKQKLMLLVFFISAVMVVLSVGFYGKSKSYDENNFMKSSRNLLVVKETKEVSELEDLEKRYYTPFLLPNVTFSDNFFVFDLYRQTENYSIYINDATLLTQEFLGEEKLIYGRMPEKDNEIVIDKWIINSNQATLDRIGLNDLNQILGNKLYKSWSDYTRKTNESDYYVIVGISDYNDNICITTERGLKKGIVNFTLKYGLYRSLCYNYAYVDDGYINQRTGNDITLIYRDEFSGNYYNLSKKETQKYNETMINRDEIIVSQTLYNNLFADISKPSNKMELYEGGKIYTIIGYSNALSYSQIVASEEMIFDSYYQSLTNSKSFSVYVNRADKKMMDLIYHDYNDSKIIDIYQKCLDYEKENNETTTVVLIIFTIVILATSLIFLLFTIRSSLISRVYEVGVYRSLGVKKIDIIKMFLCEIILLLVFSSFLGYLLSSYLLTKYISSTTMAMAVYEWYSWIISFVIIFVFSIIVGLLPVTLLLRLTPSEIISKYDI